MNQCLECMADIHAECENPNMGVCCCVDNMPSFMQPTLGVAKKDKGGQVKDPDQITDIHSTGRKRAKILWPILDGTVCEWSELLFAGGGTNPIVGCNSNPAVALHHGPDKNTINNERQNVHKVCATCHNRWHAINDSSYPQPRPTTNIAWLPVEDFTYPDAQTKASEQQIMQNELWFSVKKKRNTYAEFRAELNALTAPTTDAIIETTNQEL